MIFILTMHQVSKTRTNPSWFIQQSRVLLRSLMGTAISLGCGLTLPAHAQVQRHPRIDEAREAIATTLPDSLPSILERTTYRVDQRTSDEIKTLQAFVEAWNMVSPNTALFLGEWSSSSSNGTHATWAIYPSYKAGGRVCILKRRHHPNTEDVDYLFGVGHLVTPSAPSAGSTDFIYQLNVTGAGFSTSFQRLTTTDMAMFTRSQGGNNQDDNNRNDNVQEGGNQPQSPGTVLAEATINPRTDNVLLGALSVFPRPLSVPDFGPSSTERDAMIATFAATGCTAELPTTREWGIQSLALSETQSLSATPGVQFQFNGAYVPASTTGNSIEAYWTISNQSDRNVAIQPLKIQVETEDASPIDCPEALNRFQELIDTDEDGGCARGYLDPWQDGFLEPGDSVSGRVVILRRSSELDNLFLVIPDSVTGGLESFRVPIR